MDVEITDEGRVRYAGLDGTYEWESLTALADDYWRWSRSSGRERERDMVVWSCVEEITASPAARAVDVIQALVDGAASDQELVGVGAGPLEDLLAHNGHGLRFVDEVERRARQRPLKRRKRPSR
jgi:hypothetical protein